MSNATITPDPAGVWEEKSKMELLALCGHIPYWLDPEDPASFKEQIHRNYSHGGGWHGFNGFVVEPDGTMHYPGDPPVYPYIAFKRDKEWCFICQHAWVSVIPVRDGKPQTDEAQVARID